MVIVESYVLAVILCFVTMLCWGSWANTQKLASKEWKFQLFYWDYSIGVLLLTIILAFTLGSFGDSGRGFMEDLSLAEGSNIWSALLGGIVFNLANILLVAAIDIAGMAVAFPIGIGLALVIGVITNYVATPLGDPILIFIGVTFVAIAIIIDAIAYGKLPSASTDKSKTKGLVLSIIAGIAMGFFYRFVASSMASDFVSPEIGKLTPYTALVIFAVGLLVSNIVFVTLIMVRPFSGDKVAPMDYFRKGNPKLHMVGILGGMIWSVGMSLSIIASGAAGFAISYGLGQGATMVAAFWGVYIWKEFKDAPEGTNKLLNIMFACFIVGLTLIIAARVV
ncbi:MAG: multidrug DMT transporter permease [Labilibaculum sp.]|nr:GRP family sugar transporter [Labilibaculum sp.]MBI9060232.1 multidrug DMT transporter permease [Labilibaculum sp.]